MRLLLRLDNSVGAPIALEVTLADDATVGELADHLSEMTGQVGGLTLDGLDRSSQVVTHGPRSGTTVRLVEPVELAESVAWAPVHVLLRGTDPEVNGTAQSLRYGSNEVAGVLIHISELVEVRSTGATTPLVNGQRVLGSRRLSSGDLVTLDSGYGSEGAFVIHVTDTLEPPATAGPHIPHRSSRRVELDLSAVHLDLPTPPEHIRLPGFPVLSAVVPLLMGAGLWLATRSAASSVFIVFSFVYVVASGLESRREARADEQFRLEQFRADLEEAEELISQRHREEQEHRSNHCPTVKDLTSLILSRSERVWERPGDEADQRPLSIRVGRGRTTTSTHIKVPHNGRRDLRRELATIAEDRSLAELPLTVDMDAGGGLALIGRGEVTTDVARWILVQLAALVAPDDLRIIVLCDALRKSAWHWSSWLPHVQHAGVTQRSIVVVDGATDSEVETALSLLPEGSARLLWLSPTRAGIPKRLNQVFDLGNRPTLQVSSPHPSGEVVPTDPAHSGEVPRRMPVEDLNVEDMTDDQALPLARCLAPLVPSRSLLDHRMSDPNLGDSVRLGDVLADRDMLHSADAVLDQWSLSGPQFGLGAPVGRAGHGVIHLDLKADGPHALVAGTTGSGKSEFLRSMVASLALHNGPDRLTFLLVDYKGGAAFNSLDQLPHSVGMITDLSPELAERALVSLRAEVLRREKVLARLGFVDLDEAFIAASATGGLSSAPVPPSLVVVVDEFATLARELPDFVDGLVDIAQRGRSLGIHLILATQRPAGVVTDSIRANTSLRVALRVADPDDSTDVVDSPDAADLPRTSPGRALVRIGSSPSVQVQFAYSAAPSERPPRVSTTSLGAGPIAAQVNGVAPTGGPHGPGGVANGSTELSLAIATARAAAAANGSPPPLRPWVPPLPEVVQLDGLSDGLVDGLAGATWGTFAIGLIDRPSRQSVDPLVVDLSACGGVLVIGAGGSGRSSTLAAIGCSSKAEVHLIGPQRGVYADSSELEWLGDAIDPTDAERTLRLLRSAVAQIAEHRTTGDTRPEAGQVDQNGPGTRLILLDDYSAFEEFHERVNRGEALDLVNRIAREGRSAGVHIAISAHRRIEVPPALASSLGMHILLRCATEDDASMLGLDVAAASKDLPPGRGHVNGEVVQIALPRSAPDGLARPSAASRIASLPERVELADLLQAPGIAEHDPNEVGTTEIGATESGAAIWSSLLVGVNGDDLTPTRLNLEHSHLVVAGPRRSGRTTTLELLAAVLEASALRRTPALGTTRAAGSYLLSARAVQRPDRWTGVLNASESRILADAEGDSGHRLAELRCFFETVSTSALGGTPTLLAVDDFPDLLDSPLEGAVESGLADLVELSERAPLRIVLSGEVDAISRSFSSTLTRVRAGRTAILIQPDPDVHGSIAHCDIPRRDELRPMAGRGWLVSDSQPSPIQLAHP
ncbi:MAG: FtsK/SpoIIIE domain-containing protein [Microthrixaceae bacterium]